MVMPPATFDSSYDLVFVAEMFITRVVGLHAATSSSDRLMAARRLMLLYLYVSSFDALRGLDKTEY